MVRTAGKIMKNLVDRRVWLRSGLAMLAAGCGLRAVRPPTPAANLDRSTLNYAEPGERFYVLVFSSQTVPARPKYAHSWAAVVRTVEKEGCGASIAEQQTISWLPASLDIQPLYLHPVPPVNLGLHETIRYAQGNGERVSLWGPYECRPSFFHRFVIQKDFLESGRIGFQSDDNNGEAARTGDACCCIHAITDMDPEYGRSNYPLIWFGDSASEHIVDRFAERGSILHPETEHEWLMEALDLKGYEIKRRHYQDRLFDAPRLQPARLIGAPQR
jgi:hypothetical protein